MTQLRQQALLNLIKSLLAIEDKEIDAEVRWIAKDPSEMTAEEYEDYCNSLSEEP